MLNRIFDLSEQPCRISVRLSNLIIALSEDQEVSAPLSDVAVVIAAHPQITITQGAVAGLCAAGGALICCGSDRLPIGMMVPLVGHTTQVERMSAQVAASLPVKKRIWQQMVRAKLESQAAVLGDVLQDDAGLRDLARSVRSGDPQNLEAQGARRYWTLIFKDPNFRRDRAAPGINALLNYGYAVLRAIVARALCASGLHPSIGIHHHNRSSGYPLADDVMEPLRPLVDRVVVDLADQGGPDAPIDKSSKRALLEALQYKYLWEDERRSVFDISARMSSSLAQALLGSSKELGWPSPFGLIQSEPASAPKPP
ncbi:MAG TPA: type II CRISPR-associated endonuclease Cas1 [Planctomycetota bacterium]|nr:type II CRISPR-associated endonuclease Cas1 [Planctomycetota bacterium]